MAKRTVKVGSKVGLHARPASLVAEKAADYDDEILLFTADEEDGVDASSQMMVMTSNPITRKRSRLSRT